MFNYLQVFSFLFLLSLSLASCSSGGGDGGGGGSQDRTTETALRLIHGSIDGSPLTLKILGLDVQTARFAQETIFTPIERGENINIVVDRARSLGVNLARITSDITNGNEYTIFVYGSVGDGTETARLIVEEVRTPENGKTFLRLLNALEGSGGIVIEDATTILEAEHLGSVTDFLEVESGLRSFNIRTDLGQKLATLEIELENRSEVSVLVTGSLDLGVVYVRTFFDFD